MGRWGGRDSDKAGTRDFRINPDNVIAIDQNNLLVTSEFYDPISGGSCEVVALDVAAKNPAQALQRRRETLQYQNAHTENERRDREQARRAKLERPAQRQSSQNAYYENEKRKTLEAFGKIRQGIAQSWEKAREEQNKPKTDKAGVILQNGRAITPNGTVVEPGEWYTPRGLFKNEQSFLVSALVWRGDRIIAVGDLERGAAYTTERNKWFYPADLRPAKFGGGQLRSGKPRFFGVEI